MNRKPTVYTASKTCHSARWRELRDHGDLNIISSWIDLDDEPTTENDWATLWSCCANEATLADCCLVYLLPGECHKGSLVEFGCALASNHPVFLVNLSGIHLDAAHHPLVTQCRSLEQAIKAINRLEPADEPSLRFTWAPSVAAA